MVIAEVIGICFAQPCILRLVQVDVEGADNFTSENEPMFEMYGGSTTMKASSLVVEARTLYRMQRFGVYNQHPAVPEAPSKNVTEQKIHLCPLTAVCDSVLEDQKY